MSGFPSSDPPRRRTLHRSWHIFRKCRPLWKDGVCLHFSTTPPGLKTSASDSAFQGRQRRTPAATRTFGPWSRQSPANITALRQSEGNHEKNPQCTKSAPDLYSEKGEDTTSKRRGHTQENKPRSAISTAWCSWQYTSVWCATQVQLLDGSPIANVRLVLSLESDDQSSEVSSRVTISQKHAPSQCQKNTYVYTAHTHGHPHHDHRSLARTVPVSKPTSKCGK